MQESAVIPKEQILIVDDTPANIDVLGSMLSGRYDIRVALNGEKALEIVGSDNPPDLVLLDIMMPGMDGYEVARRIKADPLTAMIPIIFITARTDEQDEALAFEAGGVDYIRKPVNRIIAMHRIKTHLELKLYRDKMFNQLLDKDQELEESAYKLSRETMRSLKHLSYFKAVLESSPHGILMIGLDGRIMNVNEAFSRIFGYDYDEILSPDFYQDVLSSKMGALYHVITHHRDKLLKGLPVTFETMCQHKEGYYIPINALTYCIRYNGQVQGFFICYENISQRKVRIQNRPIIYT